MAAKTRVKCVVKLFLEFEVNALQLEQSGFVPATSRTEACGTDKVDHPDNIVGQHAEGCFTSAPLAAPREEATSGCHSFDGSEGMLRGASAFFFFPAFFIANKVESPARRALSNARAPRCRSTPPQNHARGVDPYSRGHIFLRQLGGISRGL